MTEQNQDSSVPVDEASGLAKCPFCGAGGYALTRCFTAGDGCGDEFEGFVVCVSKACGMKGPYNYSRDEEHARTTAIAAWNRRASVQPDTREADPLKRLAQHGFERTPGAEVLDYYINGCDCDNVGGECDYCAEFGPDKLNEAKAALLERLEFWDVAALRAMPDRKEEV